MFVVAIIRAVKGEDGVGVTRALGRKRMLLQCGSSEEHRIGGMQDFIMIDFHAAEHWMEEVYFEVAYHTDDRLEMAGEELMLKCFWLILMWKGKRKRGSPTSDFRFSNECDAISHRPHLLLPPLPPPPYLHTSIPSYLCSCIIFVANYHVPF